MPVAPQNPLEQLASSIRGARNLPEAGAYQRASDPLNALSQLLRGDVALSTPTNAPSSPVVETRVVESSLEALLGREVLMMVGSRPLVAEARREAVERALLAINNPSKENVRAILAALLSE